MLFGRFFMIVPVLAIAGSMRGKKPVPAGPGTFPTHGLLFSGLVVSVILIVGALTFFPALSLGPIAEHFVAIAGKVYCHASASPSHLALRSRHSQGSRQGQPAQAVAGQGHPQSR